MIKIDTPYAQIDSNTIVDIGIANSKIVDNKLYGPVYTRLVKKYTMQFVADKLGEEPPEGSEDWEWFQVKEYLERIHEKYPKFFNALLYGMVKTESYLQGKTGVGTRISINEMVKSMDKRVWWLKMMNKIESSSTITSTADFLPESSEVSNLEDVFKQVIDKLVSFKILPPYASYSVEDENTIKFAVNYCAYKDSCAAYQAENITKFDGNYVCSMGRILCTYLEIEMLSPDYDYLLEKFGNPICSAWIIKIKTD